MVRAMQNGASSSSRAVQAIRWEGEVLQIEHRRQSVHCNQVWHSQHPNHHHFCRWCEERCNYWGCTQDNTNCHH
ncbi:unnamed protein product [Linum tenue]|uniref:Uncharacterized protein n=1 Tax=Linum tenue TaxID=586396 RepID=A0AAV0NS11_9ROSI|nr:unnamed protein product [Linum tenue]